MRNILIAIPARYHSTRLPGKPLIEIRGVPMIQRVAQIAEYVCRKNPACEYVVATDHDSIEEFCNARGIPCLMTSESCRSGSERCWEAAQKWPRESELIINLQGDNPLCQPHVIQALIDCWNNSSDCVLTPAVRLSWEALADLENSKAIPGTRFSGTTVTVTRNGYASYFSKGVIPVMRKPDRAREEWPALSPVRQHVGLYAYAREALEAYFHMEESPYEKSFTEGLEQNRFLWNEVPVRVVDVDYRGRPITSGVDSPGDVDKAEALLAAFGELELN